MKRTLRQVRAATTIVLATLLSGGVFAQGSAQKPSTAKWAVPRTPLPAGAATNPLVMRSALGYTGEQARMQMLQNREFVDAKVEIYLKHGSKVLAKLAEYPIQRQLLTKSSGESAAPKTP